MWLRMQIWLRHPHSQFVSFEGSMVQQVEASVVLLGEINVGHHGQDLNDIAEIFSNGVVERRVPVWILLRQEANRVKLAFQIQVFKYFLETLENNIDMVY